jgi:hypothetical protein
LSHVVCVEFGTLWVGHGDRVRHGRTSPVGKKAANEISNG